MQGLRIRTNASKLGMKEDQCVTCLADDLQNLGTRSSTLRTPGILSQINNSIHKKSSKEARVKLK